jgi:hypothetical protein
MATPDYNSYVNEIWGWPDDGYAGYCSLLAAANIAIGTNPAFAITDFLSIYPQFTTTPTVVVNAYIALASASLMEARWGAGWFLAMCQYVAHFCTLWAQGASLGAASTPGQAAAAGLAIGITTSQAVHDVSVGSTPIIAGFENWGAFNLTLPGQQFMTSAKAIGSGGMLIW